MLTLILVGMLALTFNIQPVRTDSEPQLLLETDKYIYKLGENIFITLANIGNQTIYWSALWPPFDIYTYPGEELVCEALECFCIFSLAPEEIITQNLSEWFYFPPCDLIEPGTYVARDNQGWGLSTYFKIVNPDLIVPYDYPTIQEAINNANEGDSIFVRNGTYYENVVVNKTVSLIGEDRETTIIDGNGTLSVLKVVADNVNVTNFTLRNGEVDGIFVENASHCYLKNNIIDEVAWGIVLENSNFTEVSNNNITGCPWVGNYLESSNHNIISRNNITDNWSGIELWWSSYNNVSDNYIVENMVSISYYRSDYNTFSENNIENTDSIGIFSGTSDYNNVFGNNITAFNGIWLDSSYGNSISGNRIACENTGIFLGFSDGNSIFANHVIENNEGMSIYESYYNDIYHNNFINNKIQVDKSYSVNTWDDGYPSGGNFWSNYNGTDLNHDDIGDTPFVIDANNTDRYPLRKPLSWWNLADVNYDFKVNIFDVVLTCSAYNSTPSDPNWNPHCDIAEPYGVIDIYDIVMICTSYGEEYNP